MLSWIMLVALSMVNSLALTLTIWAALQLKHTDWWVVFLVIFIIGLAYQIECSKFETSPKPCAVLTIRKCAVTSSITPATTTTHKTMTASMLSWTIWLALHSPAYAAVVDLVQLSSRSKLLRLTVPSPQPPECSHCVSTSGLALLHPY